MAAPEFLCFDHLKGLPGLRHGVFTRTGGTSPPPWDSLNIGLSCGDDVDQVQENRRKMLGALGLDRAVFLSQVHGRHIHVIHKGQVDTRQLWTRDGHSGSSPVTADGVITDATGIGLVIQTADCQAVVLYDPKKKVIANVHSGWRGSIADILGNCVRQMTAEFNCRPQDILAGIGPSLGPCCSEFVHYRDEIPEPLWGYKTPDRPYFDFWQMSRDQLEGQGVRPAHIGQLPLCTVCRSDLFFSFRKAQKTGRFGTVVALDSGFPR